MRARRGAYAVAIGMLLGLTCCTLLVSLDGLHVDDASDADAPVVEGAVRDAPTPVDATMDAPLVLLDGGDPLLWYAADDGVMVVDGRVSSWADLSGRGNVARQSAVASQPTLTPGALNGKPA